MAVAIPIGIFIKNGLGKSQTSLYRSGCITSAINDIVGELI